MDDGGFVDIDWHCRSSDIVARFKNNFSFMVIKAGLFSSGSTDCLSELGEIE